MYKKSTIFFNFSGIIVLKDISGWQPPFLVANFGLYPVIVRSSLSWLDKSGCKKFKLTWTTIQPKPLFWSPAFEHASCQCILTKLTYIWVFLSKSFCMLSKINVCVNAFPHCSQLNCLFLVWNIMYLSISLRWHWTFHTQHTNSFFVFYFFSFCHVVSLLCMTSGS